MSRMLWIVGLAAVTLAGCGKTEEQRGAETRAPAPSSEQPPAGGEPDFSRLPPDRIVTASSFAADESAYPWLSGNSEEFEVLTARFEPPEGYRRLRAARGSFGDWLRGLPLRPGRPEVRLYNSAVKERGDVHAAVVLLDVGAEDLQQCADAVIRLRAEYLFASDCQPGIRFNATSGDPMAWVDWRRGLRPRVENDRLGWAMAASPDSSHANLRAYLDSVFRYAGSASLEKELVAVDDPALVRVGDIFIEGGFPGHAEIVVDVAENEAGERIFLLAQSYMPAQEVHIVRNPGSPMDPWYAAAAAGELETPEYTFDRTQLMRFPPTYCRESEPGEK